MQDFVPRVIEINGQKCALGLTPDIEAPVPIVVAPGPSAAAELSTFLQTGYVSISGNRLVGVDGQLLQLRGVNWFGFETGVGSNDPSLCALVAVEGDAACSIPLLAFPAGFAGGSERAASMYIIQHGLGLTSI